MGRLDLQIEARNARRQRKKCTWKWDEIKPTSPVESSQLPSHGHSMDPSIYRALTTGDINGFSLATQLMDADSLMSQLTPQGNTILHLAVISNCDSLVKVILNRCPNLILSVNSMGNLAHHVAANAGHFPIIKSLIGCSPGDSDWLEVGNNDGDNPLHIAIKNGHKDVAMFLVHEYPTAAWYPNKEHKSPLYMAAEVGCIQIINYALANHLGDIVTKDPALRPRIKSLVHAAIAGQNIGILDILLYRDSTLINFKDEQGRTALSYAVLTNYHVGVDYFLDNYTHTVYQANQNGFFPIHTASAKGHTTIIKNSLRNVRTQSNVSTQKVITLSMLRP